VHFRGRYRDETWELRNSKVQNWPNPEEPNYAYTDTRTKLIIDAGAQQIVGETAPVVHLNGEFYGTHKTSTPVHLGDLHTDDHGRLIFVASDGHSWDINHPKYETPETPSAFDNDDWIDPMCDGTVRVAVSSEGSRPIHYQVKNHATIISAPPKFTNGPHCPTTLLDLIEDVYEREKRAKPGYKVPPVNYYEHIDPMFRGMYRNSWTNFRANEGHGPRKAEYFIDNPALYNPSLPNTTRQAIMGRIRAPVKPGDKDNEKLRDKQSYMFYMPRLGGDNGDMPETSTSLNDRDRWASLTELQFDRLTVWSEGNFVTGSAYVPPKTLEEIPVDEQPFALTKAALQWSVGAPLYPGIEVFWHAEYSNKYKLDEPTYRFSDEVTPGDLGKGLSLPWQNDFFMCNTHWWPSVRPDNIVTEQTFEATSQHFQHDHLKIALNLTRRNRWDEGLNRDDDDERVGSAEMVRKWTKLGFVAHQPLEAGGHPIFVEKERHPDFPRTPPSNFGES